jgi:hypothetical protein
MGTRGVGPHGVLQTRPACDLSRSGGRGRLLRAARIVAALRHGDRHGNARAAEPRPCPARPRLRLDRRAADHGRAFRAHSTLDLAEQSKDAPADAVDITGVSRPGDKDAERLTITAIKK